MKATERDYRDFLDDMAKYVEKGMSIVDDLDYDAFCGNEEKVLAAIRVLEVIGEAARHVPSSVRENYLEVPWSGLARMRDKLIHGYFGVDAEVVWQSMHEDLPPLRESMLRITKGLEEKK
jgi:uncharacterized protein with HEPN domain